MNTSRAAKITAQNAAYPAPARLTSRPAVAWPPVVPLVPLAGPGPTQTNRWAARPSSTPTPTPAACRARLCPLDGRVVTKSGTIAAQVSRELRRTTPGEVTALHRAAAGWFARHGYPVQAIRYAQGAEDWELAGRLLADHWPGLHLDGQDATIHELLARFPAEANAADAELAALARPMSWPGVAGGGRAVPGPGAIPFLPMGAAYEPGGRSAGRLPAVGRARRPG